MMQNKQTIVLENVPGHAKTYQGNAPQPKYNKEYFRDLPRIPWLHHFLTN
jgi:hypothetical protein